MVYQPKNPIGYRILLTWKQAGDIYRRAKDFTRIYLTYIKDDRLTNHINDSARSVQRNIEEGYKRSTTKEYVQFIGYSRASLEELKGDFEELKREWQEMLRWKALGSIRDKVIEEINGLLELIYGEDCMIGRQIAALEHKMVKEKTLPRSEMIKRSWNKSGLADKKFWRLVESKYGIKRDQKGIMKKG
jgi:four helix bundle protein